MAMMALKQEVLDKLRIHKLIPRETDSDCLARVLDMVPDSSTVDNDGS